MRVYLENIPVGDIPQPRRRPGEFFPRLVGIRLSGDRNWPAVEPLYIPLVRIRCRAGQVLVEINSDRPLFYITLQARRPFVSVFRFPWELEPENA